MKNIKNKSNIIFALLVFALFNSACKKDEALVVDVEFRADKTSVAKGETVTFTIGAGADASSIYTGDSGHEFEKSRINLVELAGHTEEELSTALYAERIAGLQEFTVVVPKLSAIPSDYSFSGDGMSLYDGKLVPWDFSNVTNSRYIQLKLNSGAPQTLSFKPNNAVIPTMLDLNNNALGNLGAINRTANNTFAPFAAFPDGFDANFNQQNGLSVKFGIQVVIDGQESAMTYFTIPVRELLDNLNFNLDGLINNFQKDFPAANPATGIEELRLTFNADDPNVADDDGNLLAYVGNVYIQEMRIGSADNMIKAFSPQAKFALRKKEDSNVISTIANKILLDTDYEEAEKK